MYAYLPTLFFDEVGIFVLTFTLATVHFNVLGNLYFW